MIRILALTLICIPAYAQGLYTTLHQSNLAGQHTFQARALNALGGSFNFVNRGTHPLGELIALRQTAGNVILADNVLLHRNGRVGPRNLNLDTIVLPIAELAKLPANLQTILSAFETLPKQQVGRTQ